MNNSASERLPVSGNAQKASDIDIARGRLGESIEKTVNLSHHLMDRLEAVLRAPQPANAAAVSAIDPGGNTPLSGDLHAMASKLNEANDRICDLLDRLGL